MNPMLSFSTLILQLLGLVSDWFAGRIKQEAEVVARLHEILAERASAQIQLGKDLAANDAAADRALAAAAPAPQPAAHPMEASAGVAPAPAISGAGS